MTAATRARPARTLVDGLATRRMVKALAWDGYSTARIAAALEVRTAVVDAFLYRPRIEAAHAHAVAVLFGHWAGVPAEDNGSMPRSADAARARAYRLRYAPAWAWAGEDLTDPDATPARWRRTHRAVDLVADAKPLLAAGESYREVARRLGVTMPALQRARERVRARERAAAKAAPTPS